MYKISSHVMLLCCSYDGQGPDAYFYAGGRGRPSRNGFQVRVLSNPL